MSKILYIIVGSYPFGNREPYLHDEVLVLSKYFKQIYLVVPGNSDISENDIPLFVLPSNVSVIHLKNTNTQIQKLFTFFRYSPFKIWSLIKREASVVNGKFTWSMFKTLFYYLSMEKDITERLLKKIKKDNVDTKNTILYSYWFTEFTYSLYKIKKRNPEFKIFSRVHGWDVYFERHSPQYLPLRKEIIAGLDGLFTISKHAKNYLIDKVGIGKDKVDCFYLGANNFANNKPAFNNSSISLFSLSSVVPVKNIKLIIDTLCNVDSKISIIWTHIGGGDEYFLDVKKYADEKLLNKKNISYNFTGYQRAEEVMKFLNIQPIDFLINTSVSEGLPVSMMEAMSASIPVIGTDVGGVPEIIENKVNGFLLPPEPTPVEIIKVFNNYLSMTEQEVITMRINAYNTWKNKFFAEQNYQNFALRLLLD